ncbi:MAG: cadmium-translocating P-type ATPase [Desulfobacteraceae bacterium]|nr:cadmium-translocating P-type ATPase [Desulfobacteraceae bacterium]
MKYVMQGLNCANCAAKIEKKLNRLEGASGVSVNFAAKTIFLDPEHEKAAQEVIDRIEPGVRLIPEEKKDTSNPQNENYGVRGKLIRIGLAAVFFALGLIFRQKLHDTPYMFGEFAVFLTSYLLVGSSVIWTAVKNLVRGRLFDENFLMTVATVGAIAIHQLPEAVGVMLFFAVGEYFQERAVNRSRRHISELMDVRPDYANLVKQGQSQRVSPQDVEVGQIIEIKPGEKIPLDGQVISGTSFVDTSALTGESVPRKVEEGDSILSGSINDNGLLQVKVSKKFSESSVSRILELVENAASRKAPTEQFITRFARWYTPAVVFGALAIAFIPPLLISGAAFSDWIYRALILLVISCPCALVISIPLGYFGGIGSASRAGVLIKGANFLEALTKVHTVVFDKTGTLTKGVFKVNEIITRNGFRKEDILGWAALGEAHSNHPIARSIKEAYGKEVQSDRIEEYQEIKGHGIKAQSGGKTILVGNDRLLHREKIEHNDCDVEGTVVYVAVDGTYAGYLIIADEVKKDSVAAVQSLKKQGVKQTVMLTGDDENAAKHIAGLLGIDIYYAQLLPQDKVEKLEEIEARLGKDEKLVFVGDGINDAPVLARAHIGVAIGALGADAAIEAADVVLMDGNPGKLSRAISIADYTKKIVLQNIAIALGIKAVFVVLGAMGMATIWEAVFADVGVALIAIFNATRTLKYSSRRSWTSTAKAGIIPEY